MKNLYILIILLAFNTAVFSQTRSLNRFINHHKVQDNALAINVPGWMMDIAGFSTRFLKDEDETAKELLKLTNKISRIRFLIMQDGSEINSKDVKNLVANLQNDNFEELMSVKSSDAKIKIMIKEKGNSIRNITALIQDDQSLVLMTLSGKFEIDDLKNLKIWDEAEIKEKSLDTL